MTGLTPPDPWPYSPGLSGPELERHLADSILTEVQQLQTRWPPWTVRAVTVRLVCTFRGAARCSAGAGPGTS